MMCRNDWESEISFQASMEHWRKLARKYKKGREVSFFDNSGNVQTGTILSNGCWYDRIVLREDGLKSIVHVEILYTYEYFIKLKKENEKNKRNYVRRN